MLDSDNNNGVQQGDCVNGNGAEAPAAKTRRRILTRDLSARIAELEGRIEVISAALAKPHTPSELELKVTELAQQIAKLDERVTKIAHAVAQTNLMHSTLS